MAVMQGGTANSQRVAARSFSEQVVLGILTVVSLIVAFNFLVLAGITAVILLPFGKDGVVYGFQWDKAKEGHETDSLETETYKRRTCHFSSKGVTCEAWLYCPKAVPTDQKAPVIVMAHGMGVQKDIVLQKYAEKYAAAGFAVFMFDYRGWGGSEGEPRQWISATKQLEDYEAAIQYIRSGALADVVDSNCIVAWGTSYSGGHALTTAAKLKGQVRAVVAQHAVRRKAWACVWAQEPFLCMSATVRRHLHLRGALRSLRVCMVALHNQLRRLSSLSPAYVKLVGRRGEFAMDEFEEEDFAHFVAHQPAKPLGGWRNAAYANFGPEWLFYRPMSHIANISCPVFLVAGTRDDITPAWSIRKAHAVLSAKLPVGAARLLEYPATHFGLYLDPHFSDYTAQVIDWLQLVCK